jgi:hypothetical protein
MASSPQQAVGGEDAAATATRRLNKLQSESKTQRAKIKDEEQGCRPCPQHPRWWHSFIRLLTAVSRLLTSDA